MEHERHPKLFPVKSLAEMLIHSRKRSIEEDPPLPVNMSKTREEFHIVTGIHEIYGSLYDER